MVNNLMHKALCIVAPKREVVPAIESGFTTEYIFARTNILSSIFGCE